MKDGAKILAPALEENTSIQQLDLSQNNLGVYGTTLIAKALHKNKTLKGLNLFKNTIDVDGSRALRDLLKVNSTIEFLDVGHNRIRMKGLEALSQGILENPKSSLKTLGLRMNFINDDGFQRFFDEVVFNGDCKLQYVYINENNLSQYKTTKLADQVKNLNVKGELDLFVDKFEKACFLTENRLKNTIWFGPIDNYQINTPQAKRRLLRQFAPHKVGLVSLPLRLRIAKKIGVKTNPKSIYLFVEFENQKSVEIAKVTKLVHKGKINISRKAYLAGTNTFVAIRRSKRR
mmetsp:Transcript_34673/g.53120  ORF Transcript_34673/g.53120 Transcript_34673/m.53120 type:complete len:289 (-) Transcript_34673:29-895(-)